MAFVFLFFFKGKRSKFSFRKKNTEREKNLSFLIIMVEYRQIIFFSGGETTDFVNPTGELS